MSQQDEKQHYCGDALIERLLRVGERLKTERNLALRVGEQLKTERDSALVRAEAAEKKLADFRDVLYRNRYERICDVLHLVQEE